MHWEPSRWRKLYIQEEGPFSALPVYVRALAAELLKFCDDEGRFYVGSKDHADVIARITGADASDRRLMRRHVPLLMEDGYLFVDGPYLCIRNFATAQSSRWVTDGCPSTSRSRVGNDQSTDMERPGNDFGTTSERLRNDTETKSGPSARNRSSGTRIATRALALSDPEREDKKRRGENGQTPVPVGTSLSHSTPRSIQGGGDGRGHLRDVADSTLPPPGPSNSQLDLVVCDPASQTKPPDPVTAVFNAYLVGWNKVVRGNRKPTLDDKRRRLIKARLKTFSVEDLIRACEGVWLSKWHVDEQRTGIDLVLRDTGHVEQFMACVPEPELPPPPPLPLPPVNPAILKLAAEMPPAVLLPGETHQQMLSRMIAQIGR